MTTRTTLASGSAFAGFGRLKFGPQVRFAPDTGSGSAPVEEKPNAEGKSATPEESPAAGTASEKGDPSTETKPAEEKPKPTDAEARLLREVMEKKGKIAELETALNDANARLKAFDGIDPEQIKTLLKEKADADKTEAEKRGEFDRVKEMMAAEHANEVETFKTQIDSLKTDYEGRIQALEAKLSQAETVINDLTIGSAFDNSSFIAEELVLTPSKARVIYGAHYDVVDGKVVPFDKPRGAEGRTQMVDASGNPLGFEEALKRLVGADPEREKLVKSTMKNGAGSSTDPNAKAAPAAKEVHGMSRIAAALTARRSGKK